MSGPDAARNELVLTIGAAIRSHGARPEGTHVAIADVLLAGGYRRSVTPAQIHRAASHGYEAMFEGELPSGIETDLWRNVARAAARAFGLDLDQPDAPTTGVTTPEQDGT